MCIILKDKLKSIENLKYKIKYIISSGQILSLKMKKKL